MFSFSDGAAVSSWTYTVNGHALSAVTPYPPYYGIMQSIALPIPLSALVAGPQVVTLAGDSATIVSNVNVVLAGAGAAGSGPPPPPPPPPGAPASVSSAVEDNVKVTWQAVSGATSYNVRRSSAASGVYTVIGSQILPTSFSDLNVPIGTTYWYTISSLNASGEGPQSTPVSRAIQ